MKAYPDTSFLCAFYVKQTNSGLAAAYAATMKEPLHITELVRFEFRQSLRFQVWRRSSNAREGLARADAETALDQLEADLACGVAVVVPCHLGEVLRRADDLSKRHTMTEGHRSFDILHVAAAIQLDAQEFLTFDEQQRKMAQMEGLKVKP